MNCKIKHFVRFVSAWAWADEIEMARQAVGSLRWKSDYDWWLWYVVEVGAKGGHDIIGHANPIVRKAWNAARERVPCAITSTSGEEQPPPVWVNPPDCPRCGRPMEAIKHSHGEWICRHHEEDGKCLWYNYELIMILRSRLSSGNTGCQHVPRIQKED